MTRRERIEARLEKRLEWAAGRTAKAAASFNRAHSLTDGIPFGQPILVGHHSEKRHRNTIDKANNAMRSGIESQDMAKTHSSKADGLERQLEHSIFSDDSDAVQALEERVQALEARRAWMKAENAAFRKGDAAWAAVVGITVEQAAARRVSVNERYSWMRQPHPAYSLSNLSSDIRRNRLRIVEVKARAADVQAADLAGGFKVVVSGASAKLTFSDYPGRETVHELKERGFWFRGGSWFGPASALPAQYYPDTGANCECGAPFNNAEAPSSGRCPKCSAGQEEVR